MTGSVPIKLARLAANLIANPSYLGRYLRHNAGNQTTPLNLGLPWIPYAAIDFLEGWLRPEMNVCEYGSGGSTVFFARRVKSVFTIEDNPDWHGRVQEHLAQESLANVTLRLCPFDFEDPKGFEHSEYLQAMPDARFDVIMIDSTEAWVQVRPALFRHAEERILPGGIILVDDSWRYPSLKTSHHALHRKTFQSTGPGRPGVTTTDIFFY